VHAPPHGRWSRGLVPCARTRGSDYAVAARRAAFLAVPSRGTCAEAGRALEAAAVKVVFGAAPRLAVPSFWPAQLNLTVCLCLEFGDRRRCGMSTTSGVRRDCKPRSFASSAQRDPLASVREPSVGRCPPEEDIAIFCWCLIAEPRSCAPRSTTCACSLFRYGVTPRRTYLS
jgi:hypothetical protein